VLDGIDPDGLEAVIGDQTLDPRVEDLDDIGILRVEILERNVSVAEGTLLHIRLVVVV
jgi:hypothetical protein